MKKFFFTILLHEETGQSAVETSLIYFLVAIAVSVTLYLVRGSLLINYEDIFDKFTKAIN